MTVIGIDPGATGALVVIEDGKVQFVADTVNIEKINEAMSHVLFGSAARPSVFIEHQQYMAKGGRAQGAKSAFSLGRAYGFWLGYFEALNADVHIASPREWQRYHYGSGTVVSDPKVRSIRRAQQLLPGLDLIPPGCKVARHGRADAALIALFGVAVLRKRGRNVDSSD